jgi:hypothetical protein
MQALLHKHFVNIKTPLKGLNDCWKPDVVSFMIITLQALDNEAKQHSQNARANRQYDQLSEFPAFVVTQNNVRHQNPCKGIQRGTDRVCRQHPQHFRVILAHFLEEKFDDLHSVHFSFRLLV